MKENKDVDDELLGISWLCQLVEWKLIYKWSDKGFLFYQIKVLYTSIDQTLMYSLHGLLNWEIGGLDCHVITVE